MGKELRKKLDKERLLRRKIIDLLVYLDGRGIILEDEELLIRELININLTTTLKIK